jgi:hypothetical protein
VIIDNPSMLPFPTGGGEDVHVDASHDPDTMPRGPSVAAADREERRRQRWRGQVARVNEKAQRPDTEARRCVVFGCGRPSRAATGNGLDRRYCRPHADHLARHGDPEQGTFTVKELAPYRTAARRWLKAQANERVVKATLQRIERRMQGAGPVVEANSLRGRTPAEKARAVWARLRSREVPPARIAEAWLTVWLAAAHSRAMLTRRDREFRQVQTAKAVHRLASGYHRRWVNTYGERTVVTELHKFPTSAGRVLRHLGSQLDDACDWLSGRDHEDFMRETGVIAPQPGSRATTKKPRRKVIRPVESSGAKPGVKEVEMPDGGKLIIKTN